MSHCTKQLVVLSMAPRGHVCSRGLVVGDLVGVRREEKSVSSVRVSQDLPTLVFGPRVSQLVPPVARRPPSVSGDSAYVPHEVPSDLWRPSGSLEFVVAHAWTNTYSHTYMPIPCL